MYLLHDGATGAAAKEKDTHLTKNRVLAAGIGILATAAVLVGCSDDKGNEPAASSGSGTRAAQVSNGGSSEVKVEGQNLAGLDLNSVTCVKAGGKINVASAAGSPRPNPGCVAPVLAPRRTAGNSTPPEHNWNGPSRAGRSATTTAWIG